MTEYVKLKEAYVDGVRYDEGTLKAIRKAFYRKWISIGILVAFIFLGVGIWYASSFSESKAESVSLDFLKSMPSYDKVLEVLSSQESTSGAWHARLSEEQLQKLDAFFTSNKGNSMAWHAGMILALSYMDKAQVTQDVKFWDLAKGVLEKLEVSTQKEPLVSSHMTRNLAGVYFYLKNYDLAIQKYKSLVAMSQNFFGDHDKFSLAQCYYFAGNKDESQRLLGELEKKALVPGDIGHRAKIWKSYLGL